MKSPFLHEWVFAHAEARPEAPAIATPTDRLSYGELAARVREFAAHLAASGFRAGERMLVALPNTPAAVVASLAVQSMGGTPVEVNRDWAPEVLAEIAARAATAQAIVWARDARAWQTVCTRQPMSRLWVVDGGPLHDPVREALSEVPHALLLEDGRIAPALGSAPSPTATRSAESASSALVLYTSGSTGRPRGVIQTYRNIDANTRSIVEYLGLSAEDRALLILPLYYCYGRSVLQTHLFAGGSVYLDNRFAFPRTVLQALGTEDCTGFAGVPLTFEIIRRKVEVSTLSFPRLRYLTQAGGAMTPDTIDWVRKAFHPAKLYVMYGQTEATSRLSYLPPERSDDKRGSIGIAIPGVRLAVIDNDGRPVPDGQVGNLVAQGDNVTPGYIDDAEETAVVVRDGWLWTGDLAHRDSEGYFFHRGRSKEILKIGGHRVSPVEIEQIICRHLAVAEAAVIGIPDRLMGELPAAYVVLRPGAAISQSDIQQFCRKLLPAYQVPAVIHFADSLPRNGAGKLLREVLRVRAAAQSDKFLDPDLE